MKIESYEVFSRQTTASWRVLVAVGSSLVVIKYFGYNDTSWDIFGRTIEPEHFQLITSSILGFSMISYLVNWYGDYVGWSAWFKNRSVEKNEMFKSLPLSTKESLLSHLNGRLDRMFESTENAKERVLELEEFKLEDIQARQGDRNVARDLEILRTTVKENSEALRTIKVRLDGVEELLTNVSVNFSRISVLSKFLLFGWYLVFPMTIALVALLLPWNT